MTKNPKSAVFGGSHVQKACQPAPKALPSRLYSLGGRCACGSVDGLLLVYVREEATAEGARFLYENKCAGCRQVPLALGFAPKDVF